MTAKFIRIKIAALGMTSNLNGPVLNGDKSVFGED
jgi:hypothetical protein